MRIKGTLVALGLVAAFGLAAAPDRGEAVSFDVVGVSDSRNTATVDFVYDGTNKLTIAIVNTATGSTDPRITGFAFNAPDAVTGIVAGSFSASGTQNDGDWSAVFDPNGIKTPGNNGFFDIGGVTQGNDITGGSPNSGIALPAMAGSGTGTFVFTLDGDATALGLLDEGSFLSLLSAPKNGQSGARPFAVRFQQLDIAGGSDIAFGGPNGGGVTPVPLPAAAWLLIASFAGMGAMSLRRKAA